MAPALNAGVSHDPGSKSEPGAPTLRVVTTQVQKANLGHPLYVERGLTVESIRQAYQKENKDKFD
jgi:hypothetical protein